jgi:hypothetical protein
MSKGKPPSLFGGNRTSAGAKTGKTSSKSLILDIFTGNFTVFNELEQMIKGISDCN